VYAVTCDAAGNLSLMFGPGHQPGARPPSELVGDYNRCSLIHLANSSESPSSRRNVFVAWSLSDRSPSVTASVVSMSRRFQTVAALVGSQLFRFRTSGSVVRLGKGVGCRSSTAIDELDMRANFPSRPTSRPTMCRNAGLVVRDDVLACSGLVAMCCPVVDFG